MALKSIDVAIKSISRSNRTINPKYATSFKGEVAIGFAKQPGRFPSQRPHTSASRYVISEHRRKIHYHSPTIASNEFNTIKIWLRISNRLKTHIEARPTWKNLEIYSEIQTKVYYNVNTKIGLFYLIFIKPYAVRIGKKKYIRKLTDMAGRL